MGLSEQGRRKENENSHEMNNSPLAEVKGQISRHTHQSERSKKQPTRRSEGSERPAHVSPLACAKGPSASPLAGARGQLNLY